MSWNGGDVVDQVVARRTGLLDPIIEVRPVATQVDDLLSEIRQRAAINERVLVTTLTKRMAKISPNISKNMASACVIFTRISTPSNVWRLSATCVWVSSTCWWGSTYCAKVWHMPEVLLVAILDADKEGFLRSERSLICRPLVVRHVTLTVKRFSTAIRSPHQWRKRLGRTERRREKQQKYNEEHGITPQGLNKKVVDILALGQNIAKTKARAEENRDRSLSRIMCQVDMSPKALQQKIHELEGLMMQHAQNLEFEEAAQIRDQLHQLRELFIAAS